MATDPSPHSITDDGFTTTGVWFGSPERPLAGWWTSPGSPSRSGVVIAPPLGYEYWSTHRSLRTLAESLAQAGWHVLRFDWDGTGDSAGEANDPGRVAAWRASLAHAVTTMRDAGIGHMAMIGVRLGATFALLDAAALGIDAVIACAPVAGKRFVRELKMLGIADPEQPDTITYSGLVIDSGTAADLAMVNPEKTAPPQVKRTLVMARSAAESAKLVATLQADGRNTDLCECPQMQTMLDTPTGEDTVPEGWVETIRTWMGSPQRCTAGIRPPSRLETKISVHDGWIIESFTAIDDMVAVSSRPIGSEPDTVVVFLNSGADPHVGPGRAWVEYARTLALHGYACLRPDFTAFGESPDHGRSPGRPYDLHCLDDTSRMVATLHHTYPRVVLAGLCVGAWIAMRVAQTTRVEGVFALNPQLWWKHGLPIIIRIPDTIAWRGPMRMRQHRLARLGVWSFLDRFGLRPMASRWLIALRRRRVPVMLSYAEGDDGLAHLRDCCSRRLAIEQQSGWLTLEEVSGIDHPMFRLWRRPAIIEQMLRFLAALPPARSGHDT